MIKHLACRLIGHRWVKYLKPGTHRTYDAGRVMRTCLRCGA